MRFAPARRGQSHSPKLLISHRFYNNSSVLRWRFGTFGPFTFLALGPTVGVGGCNPRMIQNRILGCVVRGLPRSGPRARRIKKFHVFDKYSKCFLMRTAFKTFASLFSAGYISKRPPSTHITTHANVHAHSHQCFDPICISICMFIWMSSEKTRPDRARKEKQ